MNFDGSSTSEVLYGRSMVEPQVQAMKDRLNDYISREGLKTSRQRELIADVFFTVGGHVSVDELLAAVHRQDAGVGQATVYRTMKLLTMAGLAVAREFGDGQARYELSSDHDHHHDHLICVRCGRIVEFVEEHIERLQDTVAAQHGFVVTHHKMELYGVCPTCQAVPRGEAEQRSPDRNPPAG
jgi:Fur family transcriptional regulator, ferric uptake regulator